MKELTIKLDTESGQHLYEQIYDYIRTEIKEGKLSPGEKLPSTRFLAEYLQVSRATVDMAYGQLTSEGYVEAIPYRGFFICKIDELYSFAEKTAEKDETSEPFSVLREKSDNGSGEVSKKKIKVDFSPTKIEMDEFPFDTWRKITKNILNYGQTDLFALGNPQGDRDLRETIGKYLHSSRGVNCTPEQIIVGAGNDYLLMLLEKILGRHLRIGMENPTYTKAYRIFQSFAYEITTVPMDASGIRVDELRKQELDIAYVMPSHQFPTGIVMPIGRRMELLKWASEKEKRYIIEDDYDSEFRYRSKPIPSLQASDKRNRVIYMGTFSKSIAPAIRVSYMVLPPELLEIYRKVGTCYSSTVSRIDQRILNEFIRDGAFERYLNRMRKRYRMKHDCLMELLEEFGNSFEMLGENAGLHILLRDKKGRKEKWLVEQAASVGVKVYGLGDYLVGQGKVDETATIMLGYATLKEEQIREGTALLKEVWLS